MAPPLPCLTIQTRVLRERRAPLSNWHPAASAARRGPPQLSPRGLAYLQGCCEGGTGTREEHHVPRLEFPGEVREGRRRPLRPAPSGITWLGPPLRYSRWSAPSPSKPVNQKRARAPLPPTSHTARCPPSYFPCHVTLFFPPLPLHGLIDSIRTRSPRGGSRDLEARSRKREAEGPALDRWRGGQERAGKGEGQKRLIHPVSCSHVTCQHASSRWRPPVELISPGSLGMPAEEVGCYLAFLSIYIHIVGEWWLSAVECFDRLKCSHLFLVVIIFLP